jgi:hypothetical protein
MQEELEDELLRHFKKGVTVGPLASRRLPAIL